MIARTNRMVNSKGAFIASQAGVRFRSPDIRLVLTILTTPPSTNNGDIGNVRGAVAFLAKTDLPPSWLFAFEFMHDGDGVLMTPPGTILTQFMTRTAALTFIQNAFPHTTSVSNISDQTLLVALTESLTALATLAGVARGVVDGIPDSVPPGNDLNAILNAPTAKKFFGESVGPDDDPAAYLAIPDFSSFDDIYAAIANARNFLNVRQFSRRGTRQLLYIDTLYDSFQRNP